MNQHELYMFGLWENHMEDYSSIREERWGKIIVTFDNGQSLENDGWTEKDGDDWAEWIASGTPMPDDDVDDPAEILGLNRDRVLAIQWIPEDTY